MDDRQPSPLRPAPGQPTSRNTVTTAPARQPTPPASSPHIRRRALSPAAQPPHGLHRPRTRQTTQVSQPSTHLTGHAPSWMTCALKRSLDASLRRTGVDHFSTPRAQRGGEEGAPWVAVRDRIGVPVLRYAVARPITNRPDAACCFGRALGQMPKQHLHSCGRLACGVIVGCRRAQVANSVGLEPVEGRPGRLLLLVAGRFGADDFVSNVCERFGQLPGAVFVHACATAEGTKDRRPHSRVHVEVPVPRPQHSVGISAPPLHCGFVSLAHFTSSLKTCCDSSASCSKANGASSRHTSCVISGAT
jgi:hypothetical protein